MTHLEAIRARAERALDPYMKRGVLVYRGYGEALDCVRTDIPRLCDLIAEARRLLVEAPTIEPVNRYPTDWWMQRDALLAALDAEEEERT